MATSLDREGLLALGKRKHDEYVHAKPYPHVAIDGMWPADLLDRVLNEFPSHSEYNWTTYDNANEKKYVCSDPEAFGAATTELANLLNSSTFVRFLERLTGIEHLIPDPHFHAAGLFDIPEGGWLDLHADWSGNPDLLLDRRINVLIYLNHDWTEENGGQLELWDRRRHECVERILPLFNRTVIFNTTGGALHGHPTPVSGEGKRRRVMSAYYFTNGRVPLNERWGTHGVLFNDEKVSSRTRVKRVAREITPPFVYDVVRSAKGRLGHSDTPDS